jgi:hypothetical protein
MSTEVGRTDGGFDVPVVERDRVELSFTLRPDLVFLARMTAAAVASRAQFGIDQVEDLRLAIDELCVTLAGAGGPDARLHLLFEWEPGTIKVLGTLLPADVDAGQPGTAPAPAPVAPPTPDELSARILDALVDEHGTDSTDGASRAWIVVRRTSQG